MLNKRSSKHYCYEFLSSDLKTNVFGYFTNNIGQLEKYKLGVLAIHVQVIENEGGNYFAWWNEKTNQFQFIYPNKVIVKSLLSEDKEIVNVQILKIKE